MAALRRVAEQNLAEVRDTIGGYFRERDALERISRKELARRLKDGLVTVLDVRPEDEFTAGHLPQAVNYPFASTGTAAPRSPEEQAGRYLLPRTLLCPRLQGGRTASRSWVQGPPSRGWLSRMEGCRAAGRLEVARAEGVRL